MRLFLLLSRACLLAILAFGLAACRNEKAPTTLRIIGEAVPTTQALAEVAQRYETEAGVKVVVEQYEFETAVEKATLDLSSRKGYYDIVLQPHMSLGKFVTSGFLEPLDSYLQSPQLHNPSFDPHRQLIGRFWRELSWYDGKIYGFPFTANTMYLAYRKDMLTDSANRTAFQQRYGYELVVPETWNQYRDVAEFFTRPDQTLYGTALQGRRHPAVWYEWLNFAYSWKGGIFRKEHGWEYGPIILGCPETIEATKYYKSLVRFSPPGTLEYTWDDQLADVQQGKVFMAIMWSDAVPALEDRSQSPSAGKFGYAMLPSGPAGRVGQIAGWSFHISRFSNNKNEAFKFIEWALRPENQTAQQLKGGASPLRATYADPRIQRLPYTKAYTDTLAIASAMSDSYPEATAVSDRMQICLSEILATSGDVEAQLKACGTQVAQLLKARSIAVECQTK